LLYSHALFCCHTNIDGVTLKMQIPMLRMLL
jgi:hypothetical protein